MNQMLSTMEVCELLRLKEHQLRYAFRMGYVSKPQTTIAGRMVFDLEDVKQLCDHFHIDIADELDRQEKSCIRNTHT